MCIYIYIYRERERDQSVPSSCAGLHDDRIMVDHPFPMTSSAHHMLVDLKAPPSEPNAYSGSVSEAQVEPAMLHGKTGKTTNAWHVSFFSAGKPT